MKRLIVLLSAAVLVLPVFGQEKAPVKEKEVYIFYSPHCGACAKMIREFLPGMQKEYEGKIVWHMIDASQKEGLSMLLRVCDLYKAKPVYPSALIGNVFLAGSARIHKSMETAINDFLSGKHGGSVNYGWKDLATLNTLMLFFKKITLWTVVVTGLVDGVNPCAFAVIAFFVSFLAVYGYRKREIVMVGSAYCLAVFVTYILLGMGMFEVIYRSSGFFLLKKVFYYLMAGFCFLLFGLALYDYVKFRKTGETGDMALQLPKFLKKNINLVIGKNMRAGKDRGALSLMATSFFVGILVSLLEGACTGQLYLPAITMIAQSVKMRFQAFLYLLLYNVMFILPLIVIFVLSFWGVSSQKFNAFLKQHIGRIKIAMAIVFLLMGGLILLFVL